MLFWLMLIILAVGIIGCVKFNGSWKTEGLYLASSIVTVIVSVVVVVMLIVLACSYINIDGYIESNNKRYESLTYQYENNIYDNDNDLGKRELMVDIQKWNEDLARLRESQDDFWIGIFIPDIYDRFEFIEYES